jgi:hypothetical protein
MDARRFAELSKRVAAAETRRGMVRVLGAGLVATIGGAVGGGEQPAEAAFGYCSPPGVPCSKNKKCCSGSCKKGVCGCKKRGAPCINRVGIACCSGKCRKGKCK